MKKIISIIVLISLIIPNIYASNNDQSKYDKLLKTQTKQELQMELKLFKLQKNLIGEIESNYNLLLNNSDTYLKELKKIGDKNYIMNNNSEIKLSWKGTKNLENLTQWQILNENNIFNINSNYTWKLKTDNKSTQFWWKWNFWIDILNNSIDTKYNLDWIIWSNKNLYLNLKNIFISWTFEKNNILWLLNPTLWSEEWFNAFVKQTHSTINLINKIWIQLQNKNIEISDNQIAKQINNIWLTNTYNFNTIIDNYKTQIKAQKILEVLHLLKTEKIFHIYKQERWNKYRFFYNNKLAYSINKIIWKDVMPIISFEEFKKMEWERINTIEVLNDGSFKFLYKVKNKKTSELDNVVYMLFDESNISTLLLKDKDKILYLNKNILKLRSDNLIWYFSFANNEFKTKFSFINNGYKLIMSSYLKEELQAWIINLELQDIKQQINWNVNFMFIKDALNNIKLKFNILWKTKNINSPFLNNNGQVDIDGDYIINWNKIKSAININDTSILPVNISWNINSNMDVTYKPVSINIPSKIDKKFNSIWDFINYYFKK